MNCWVCNPTAQLRPAQRLFPFRFQLRPSSLATTPIRQSCHLSGCQLIIMIFQLHSALNLDQGLCRFSTRVQHKEAHGRQASLTRKSAWRGPTFHVYTGCTEPRPEIKCPGLQGHLTPSGTGQCDSNINHKRAARLGEF